MAIARRGVKPAPAAFPSSRGQQFLTFCQQKSRAEINGASQLVVRWRC
jgi:hypothetical protein